MPGLRARRSRVDRIHSVAAMRTAARRRLPGVVRDFVEGGAEDEITLARNTAAFADVELRPRVLVDVSARDASTEVCGIALRTPVVLAPIGMQGLIWPSAELGAGRAAARAGTALIVSSASTRSIEEIASGVDPGALWFQLYPWRDRALMGELMARARDAGYAALCVTVDVPVTGGRERDLRRGLTIPLRWSPRLALDVARRPGWLWRSARAPRVTLANLAGPDGVAGGDAMSLLSWSQELMNPAHDWATVAWIRERWSGPLLVKGILDPADALRAANLGADGIVVSNHGGRQLDGAPAAIDALPRAAEAVGAHVDLVLDGGVRRGADVVKALALGAKACLIGRAYLYGMAVAGEQGVARVLGILDEEIDRTLALLGRPRATELDAGAVGPSRKGYTAAR